MDVIKMLTSKSSNTTLLNYGGPENRVEISRFYPFFGGALFRQKKLLLEKIKEIEEYKHVPTDYDNDPTLNEVMREFNKQTDTRLSALRLKYNYLLLDIRISIILFSTALLEGLINEYLAIKSRTQEEFNRVEKKSIYEKWTKLPCAYIPSYKIEGKQIDSLERLFSDRRNLMVHNKPTIRFEGKEKIKGSAIKSEANETDLLLEWCELPQQLVDNLFSFDKSEELWILKDSCDHHISRKY